MSDQGHVVSLLRDTSALRDQQQLGEATSQIQYNSQGHALVVGDSIDSALKAAASLSVNGVTVVEINAGIDQMHKRLTDNGIAVFTVPRLVLSGYLGAYKAIVPAPSGSETDFDLGVSVCRDSGCFDVVLDLSSQALMPVYLPPFGYKHATSNQQMADAIDELKDMQGEFEKPRYYNYNEGICAHSRSELKGCNRCIDVCATGAIISKGEGISVDPFLCQGCGSCATVCPSGAMSYAYPRPSNAIDRARTILAQSEATIVLLYAETHMQLIEATSFDPAVLTLQVEEVSAFGADFWLSMLSGKASRVVLMSDAESDDPSRHAILEQIAMVQQLWQGLGVDEEAVRLIDSEFLNDPEAMQSLVLAAESSTLRTLKPADFATHNDKRQTLRLALDSLSEQLVPTQKVASLSAGAPFGQIIVDQQSCTLCMACVSTCPAKALLDGQDTPALRFVEANCLQCGLCEAACPESAITLQPQYTWDSIAARQVNTLHEEAPFHCLICHTPFTTGAMIDLMSEKLAGHWMFEDPKALRRLKMCGDCRVKDMFEEDRQGIDVHKPG